MLKAYLDGSGTSGSSEFLTLACVCGPESFWPKFEREWLAVLDIHDLESWHTKEAMAGKPGKPGLRGRPSEGPWSRQTATAAFRDLHALLRELLADAAASGFSISSCTVNMADYHAVKATNLSLRPAEAICVETCVGAIPWHETQASLVFDRNEPFRKQVEQVWTKDRKKSHVKWARQIDSIEASSSEDATPLQAADLLAWTERRRWAKAPGVATYLAYEGHTVRYHNATSIRNAYSPQREESRRDGIKRAGRRTRETR